MKIRIHTGQISAATVINLSNVRTERAMVFPGFLETPALHSLHFIASLVEANFGLLPGETRNKSRRPMVSWPRSLAMHFAFESGATHAQIGQFFGKTPSAICHACKLVRNRIETEPKTLHHVEAIKRQLEAA